MSVDIVSKAVGVTYERVQTLGIYCWQPDAEEKEALYFLPRLSFNANKDYLDSIYPGISGKTELQGKGIFTSVWKIKNHYKMVSILHPENDISDDKHALSAFKAWVNADLELKAKKDGEQEAFLQVYVLQDEHRFPKYKYTEVQNPSGAKTYYSWDEILEKEEIKGK